MASSHLCQLGAQKVVGFLKKELVKKSAALSLIATELFSDTRHDQIINLYFRR
jgi:hypothetical protein